MTLGNQTSTRSKDEIRIFAPWAYLFIHHRVPDDCAALCDGRGHGSQGPCFAIRHLCRECSREPCSAATPC